MKQFIFTGLMVLALLGLTACGGETGTAQAQLEQTTQTVEAAGNMEREDAATQEQTEYISAVPEEYFAPSDHPGQVVEVTYDSRDYTDASEPAIQKTAYCCVGTSDGIASYRTMEGRVRRIQANGTDAEIEVFQGLPHGFGLGEGTAAEGWIDHAIAFWERQMR